MKRIIIILALMPFFVHAEPSTSAFLTSLEKGVLDEMNLARTKPAMYATYLEEYRKFFSGNLVEIPGRIALRTSEGTRAVDEAIRALKKQTPVGALTSSKGISKAAKDHVNDTGPGGITGHNGRDRSSPFDRMNRYGSWQHTAGENISYGNDIAREVIMQLLIDDNVPSRGHRKNIFNAEFKITGIGCGLHKVYRHMCVIDYAGGYAEK